MVVRKPCPVSFPRSVLVCKPLCMYGCLQTGPDVFAHTPGPEGLKRSQPAAENEGTHRTQCQLEAIYVYPIKSCAPQRAGSAGREVCGGGGQEAGERGGTAGRASWPLGPSGLAYDREWAVVDHRDRALRLKQVK